MINVRQLGSSRVPDKNTKRKSCTLKSFSRKSWELWIFDSFFPDSSLLSAIVFFIFLMESSTDQTHCLHFTYFLRVMFCFPVKFSMPPSCKRNVLWHDLVSHRCLVAVSLSSAGLDRRAPPLSVRLPVSSLHQTEGVFGQSGGDVVQECGQGTAGSGLAGECLRVCAVTQRPLSFIWSPSDTQWLSCLLDNS